MKSWTKEAYEKSISSLCWSWTPYDDGWDNCLKWGGDIKNDTELQEIVGMEAELGEIPEWAKKIVTGPINCVAPCGHITFPRSYTDVLTAIGSSQCPPLNHTCYTLDGNHKLRMQDLALLLDGWLADAPNVADELQAREASGWNWSTIRQGLWDVLGEHDELKDLLVERFLHQLRWWIKVSVWDDDLYCGWERDQYLGAWIPEDDLVTGNGNRQLGYLPCIDQTKSPRVQRWEKRLAEICPDWPFFLKVISAFSWPCGPKAFRYYEKLLWCIGRGRQVISLPDFPLTNPESVPNFLGSLATAPDTINDTLWWNSFIAALDAWWRKAPLPDNGISTHVKFELGEFTHLKSWLVRLYIHRLRLLVKYSGILDKLVAISIV